MAFNGNLIIVYSCKLQTCFVNYCQCVFCDYNFTQMFRSSYFSNNNNWFLYSAFLIWNTTQSALQCIITPVTGFNINPALIVNLLKSLGSILARCYFRGAHMPHHATNNVRILPGTHLYTWVESSNVDKVSCWRTKSARHWRESNPEPFDPESRVQSNIPRHLHM